MKHPTKLKSTSNYERAEGWCREVVKKGHDLLFSVDVFEVELTKSARDLGFPQEVCTAPHLTGRLIVRLVL